MKNIIITLFLLSNFTLHAQTTIENVLTEIENNNTTLSALKMTMEAEKIGARTGLFLQNPEAEFNYLFGEPADLRNKTEFEISQRFDFPTSYRHRNQISDMQIQKLETEYQQHKNEILFDAHRICVELVFHNALTEELSVRMEHAENIATSFKSKFESGETNILAYQKAQLNVLNADREVKRINAERETLLSELKKLNGGNAIDFEVNNFELQNIPGDFEEWYALTKDNIPQLQMLEQRIEMNEKEVRLSRAMSLPKFKAGYVLENAVDQRYQGFSVGMTIPLWENKNTVRYFRAQSFALERLQEDRQLHYYEDMSIQFEKATQLQQIVMDYREVFQTLDNVDFLQRALDAGEISLIEYLMELSFYYDSRLALLETEKELNLAMAEMMRFLR